MTTARKTTAKTAPAEADQTVSPEIADTLRELRDEIKRLRDQGTIAPADDYDDPRPLRSDHDYDDRRDPIGGVPYDQAPQPSPAGCLMPIVLVLLLGVIAFLVYDRVSNSPAPQPGPTPVVVPVNPTNPAASFAAPVKTKLANDRAKAAIIADAYLGFGNAVRGRSGSRIVDSRTWETASRAFLTDVDALGGTPVGAEIDTAIGGYLGMTRESSGTEPGWNPIAFTDEHRRKLAEVLLAISEAAREVAK